ncbi:c-type cytochrome [Marivita sp. S0852]|uniref:c-type cytochrome n=1 Tax=Marivita sp. S0852 TaxID=3373893 RepID=UPI003982B882
MRNAILIGSATCLAVAGGLALFLGSGANGQESGLPYTDTARVAAGAVVYQDYCASCHGANLEGEPNWKTPDADGYLPAPPHDPTGHTWHHDDALLIQIVTHGTEAIVGGTYKSRMEGYGDILTADEILNVLAYIKSTWPDEVRDIHNEINARSAGNG